jgi:hypothetical protein
MKLTENISGRVRAVAAYLSVIICMEKLRNTLVAEVILGAIQAN